MRPSVGQCLHYDLLSNFHNALQHESTGLNKVEMKVAQCVLAPALQNETERQSILLRLLKRYTSPDNKEDKNYFRLRGKFLLF